MKSPDRLRQRNPRLKRCRIVWKVHVSHNPKSTSLQKKLVRQRNAQFAASKVARVFNPSEPHQKSEI